MRVRIEHETHYAYDGQVRSLIQSLRLTPRSHNGQHVKRWRIEPSVDGRLRPREDALGNLVHQFSSDTPASALSLRVVGEIETSDTHGVVLGTVERAPALYYLRETDLTTADDDLYAFAEDAAGDRSDALAMMHRLSASLHEAMTFDQTTTHAATTAAEAFAARRGVCQDITHIFLACARHLGIPARYVSGYFLRADGVVQQEAGHAWAEAKIPDLGWVGFDATNGICVSEAHVRVAIGLDYNGAAPVRGSRVGGGGERLAVTLNVENTQSQVQD
jgi:transglutaminase-like putative cysteine protease